MVRNRQFSQAECKPVHERGRRKPVGSRVLWHKLTRINGEAGLQAEVTSFVPVTDDPIELMKVKLTNVGEQTLKLTPTAAIPLYGRSADDLRDHRHVTSLLHRIFVHRKGIEVQPALSFDERVTVSIMYPVCWVRKRTVRSRSVIFRCLKNLLGKAARSIGQRRSLPISKRWRKQETP